MNERWDFFKTGIIIWNAYCLAEKLPLFILEYHFFPSQNLQLLKKEKILLGFWDYKGWTEEDLLSVKEGTQQVLHIHFFAYSGLRFWNFMSTEWCKSACIWPAPCCLSGVQAVTQPAVSRLWYCEGKHNYFIPHFKTRIRGCAFHEPNLTHWIKYMKRSESGWFKNSYFNFKQLAVLPAWPTCSWEFWL